MAVLVSSLGKWAPGKDGSAGLHFAASSVNLATMGPKARSLRPSISGFVWFIDAQSRSTRARVSVSYRCLRYRRDAGGVACKADCGGVAIFVCRSSVSSAGCRVTAVRSPCCPCSATSAGSLLCLPGGAAARRPTISAGNLGVFLSGTIKTAYTLRINKRLMSIIYSRRLVYAAPLFLVVQQCPLSHKLWVSARLSFLIHGGVRQQGWSPG